MQEAEKIAHLDHAPGVAFCLAVIDIGGVLGHKPKWHESNKAVTQAY